jgi:hypothetical protein
MAQSAAARGSVGCFGTTTEPPDSSVEFPDSTTSSGEDRELTDQRQLARLDRQVFIKISITRFSTDDALLRPGVLRADKIDNGSPCTKEDRYECHQRRH